MTGPPPEPQGSYKGWFAPLFVAVCCFIAAGVYFAHGEWIAALLTLMVLLPFTLLAIGAFAPRRK